MMRWSGGVGARWCGAALALGVLGAALAARADGVQVQVRDRVPAGEKPAIRVVADKEVEEIVVRLRRGDGEEVVLRGAIGAGEAKELRFEQDPGTQHYKGEATVTYAGGAQAKMPLEFDVTVAGGVRIRVGRGGFNLERRSLRIEAQGAPVRFEIEVRGEGDKVLGKTARKVRGPGDDGLYRLEWEAEPGAVSKVIVSAYDEGGAWARIEVIPFAIFIPHKEVVFASAKWNIRASERPKLDETLANIREAMKKNADVEDLRLYIAGYTDTMGGKGYNRRLSERRARSIGQYFRKQGLRIPIRYQGFGEDVLAVATPDNTDEERNRRALYLLSNHDPGQSKQFPRTEWKPLR